jgi:hypothetical protein
MIEWYKYVLDCVAGFLRARLITPTPTAITVVIPRFIQMNIPLPPLKLMVQSRRGVTYLLEA